MFDLLDNFRNYEQQSLVVQNLIDWAEDISGQWNGDKSGDLEQAANCANEIIEKCNDIQQLIDEMEQYNV